MVAKKESNTQHNEAKCRIDDLLELEKSPFDWWKNNRKKSKYCKASSNLLSIPATSVSRKRLFSKAGLVIANRRACLEPNFAEQLVFFRGHNSKQ